MTQPTKAQREHQKSDKESDFPDPSDFCDFGYVLIDTSGREKSPPDLRSVGR